jgi:hypothetical protein
MLGLPIIGAWKALKLHLCITESLENAFNRILLVVAHYRDQVHAKA